jgi:selenocysteine lyase/cysteine desulfurase
VTFAGSTSHALGIVATSIDWKPGDNCVVADGDFPANVVTWLNLHHKYGVEVRRIPRKSDFSVSLETWRRSSTNARELSRFLRATSSLAARLTPTPSASTCVRAASCFAWMRFRHWARFRSTFRTSTSCAPTRTSGCSARAASRCCGCGGKYLRRCGPRCWVGWPRPTCPTSSPTRPTRCPPAERFSPGERNYIGIAGLDAILGVLEETGHEPIAQRVTELRNHAAQRAVELGFEVLWQPDERRSGNLSFCAGSDDETNALYQKLDEKFSVSLRNDPTGKKWLRVSPHFMNLHADIDQLLELARA